MLFVKLSAAFTILMLSLLSSSAYAESTNQAAKSAEPIYQVEFLVLRPYQRNEINKETWSNQKPNTPYPLFIANGHTAPTEFADPLAVDAVLASLRSDQTPATADAQAITELKGFSWATEAQWNLPYTIKRINRGGEYEILMHKVWRQTATTRKKLVPLNISLALDASNQVISEQQLAYQQGSEQIKNGLFGHFAFSKGRYLHLTMDMVLAEAQAPIAAATEQYGFSQQQGSDGESSAFSFGVDKPEAVVEYYRLKETRRIKADETHYFDHPAFSVLAYVSQIKAAEPKQPIPEPVK